MKDKIQHYITECELHQSGKVILFGSRVDDTKKGGDIDLYIETPDCNFSKKIDFLVLVKQYIGDQKIDVILDEGEDRNIDRIAKSEGIVLNECKDQKH